MTTFMAHGAVAKMTVRGDDETIRALREIGSGGARSAVRSAFRPANQLVKKGLKAAVPRDLTDYGIANASQVKKSFHIRSRTYGARTFQNSANIGRDSWVINVIGPRTTGFPDTGKIRRGSDETKGDGVEVSSKLHRVEKKGGWSVPARPFIKPTGERLKPIALATVKRGLRAAIQKEAAKQMRRAIARAGR